MLARLPASGISGLALIALAMASASPPADAEPSPTFVSTWGTLGSGAGQFNWPRGIGVDAAGNVYVADSGNDRVEKFTAGGAFITAWGSYGTGPGQFKQVLGIAIAQNGEVIVTVWWTGRVSSSSGHRR